ncbi:MAG: DUF4114 domain-containing protein [Cyanobacteriota bacterium]|nr:DUF4114 domain-containing protein [Cyanobacteriota bacterium]
MLYAAVRGWNSTDSNKQLYWNRSFDDGLSWNGWQQLPGGMTSDRPPTIAAYNGQLWLVYIGRDSQLNYTSLTDPASNSWKAQRLVSDGSLGTQKAQFATLVNEDGKLAIYYVGTGKDSYLYSTTKRGDGNDTFSKSTLIKYNDDKDVQKGSGPLAAARVNGQTYLAYQGGTTENKSNAIFLTTGSADDTNWTLINGVPQPGTASHTGVGLTANSKGLVLSYSDVRNGGNVVSLQQGSGSGSSWSFSPYTVLRTPENSGGRYDGANSLYAQTGSDRVLVSRIDSSANEAIFQAWVGPLPPSLVLTPEQTRSTLTPVGDLTGDGYADALITANNVVQRGPGDAPSQLQTGVRLLSGAPTSAAFSTANDVKASRQTLQLAPAQQLNADPSSTAPTAAASLGGLPQLTISALNSAELSRITTLRANQNLANFMASASDPGSLNQLFQGAAATLTDQPSPLLWGKSSLRSSRFGDLNGDGRSDLLAVDGLERFQTAYGALGYALWDIRAAGDANGNGVDDVLLALVPKGPAYRPRADGSPSFIQPVLLDGSLFEVDKSSNTFSLDRLKAPLNPYTQPEVFDLASTSSKDYLPPLQAWIEPILGFQPGTLTGASAGSFSAPSGGFSSINGASQIDNAQILVDELGREFVVYPSPSSYSQNPLASQLRLGYRNADGSWTSRAIDIGVGAISAATPSAVFYGDRLYVAYADQNGTVRITYTTKPITPDSDPALWSWGDDAVSINNKTLTTLISPTLVANHGRLTLITPANDPATGNAAILLASSSNPEAGANSAWGSNFDADSNGFRGEASVLQVQAPDGQAQLASSLSPVAATVFHGQTVLAYASAASGLSGVVLATEPLGSAGLDLSKPYRLATTSIGSGSVKVNGISLATDQALLYLAHTQNKSESRNATDGFTTITTYYSTAYLSGFSPGPDFTLNPGAWEQQTTSEIAGVPKLGSWQSDDPKKNLYLFGNSKYTFPSSFGLALQQGSLLGWGLGSAELNTTITAPTQVSLAGYSLDGGVDINSDGFQDLLVSDPSDPDLAVNNQYALFGGDYLNIATKVGTTGDDVIAGTVLSDVIYALSGVDEVRSNGGRDVILTADGDDRVAIADSRFLRIDAGAGFDLLLLAGLLDQAYDFRLNVPEPEYFPGTRLQNIELIDSRDYGANTLSFDAAAVTAFNPNRFLFLTPDASDSIWLSSDFSRNDNFDTRFGGLLWSAFTTAAATATPSQASPPVVYVLNPEPLNPSWLDAGASGPGVRTQDPGSTMPSGARDDALAARGAVADGPEEGAAVAANQGTITPFGRGLAVTAFSGSSSDGFSRFTVSRQDPSGIQVVFYGTNPLNSRAVPGRDHPLATGTLVFQPGETSKDITVPWTPGAFQGSRGSSLSLELRELPDKQQKEVHVLVESLPDAGSGTRPTLSGIRVTPSEIADNASISLRADVNNQDQNQLRLRIGLRSSAAALAVQTSQEVAIRDFNPNSPLTLPLGQLSDLPIDRDERRNQQVGIDLKLDLLAASQGPAVSLLGPAFLPADSVETVGANQIRFLQEAPLTTWRSDSGSGRVSFGLRAGTSTQPLLSNAAGGSAGSINPTSALDNIPTSGWLATEGRAVGTSSITYVPDLTSQTWTPTATRDGNDLPLIDVAINGNLITARFAGGITAELWQASGSAPAQLPVAPSLEVQRLAGYNNDIGLYSVDGITGMVDGLNPRDPGYLQAALARSEAEDLLLTAAELPAFGKTTTYNSLPINSQKRYGILLVQNGNRSTIFSSFSDANPGGETQMVRLGSEANRFTLGLEDIAVTSGLSDRDFNDNIVRIGGVSLGLF